MIKYQINSIKTVFSRVSRQFSMKIGTHNGVFHCDEALACFMLKKLDNYKDAEIVRTRDDKILDTCDIVVDVGGVFNHEKCRYDHHQREFSSTFSSLRPEFGNKHDIRLSSAGLIYCYYGEEVIKKLAPDHVKKNSNNIKVLFEKIYVMLIKEIDGVDNGIPMFDSEPKYKIHTHLSGRVGRLNPNWNSPSTESSDTLFEKAMELVGEEFSYFIDYYSNVWLPCRDMVVDAFEKRYSTHPSGEIIEFKESFPWMDHFFTLEEELQLTGIIKYAIFFDKLGKQWRIRALPVAPDSFVLRIPLNPAWWGLREQQLSEASTIKDSIFCHANGFIGGSSTRESALAMANASLQAAASTE